MASINPVIVAIGSGDRERLREILQEGGDPNSEFDGASALEMVSAIGDAEAAKLLLDAGAQANRVGTMATTPLISAAYAGSAPIVDLLLQAGADVNAKDSETGQSAYMVASKRGHIAAMRLLESHGADVHALDSSGQTALHWAMLENDYPQAVEHLISLGLDPRQRNVAGLSPLDFAIQLRRKQGEKVLLTHESRCRDDKSGRSTTITG